MSFFGVTKEVLEFVNTHPNADRLDIGKLEGSNFQFVIPKDKFKAGDVVLYFPIDSLIPEKVLQEIGLLGLLCGKNQNRVKTKCIRGEISQGLVEPIDLLDRLSFPKTNEMSPEILTEFLGVEKYEPEAILEGGANLLPLPNFLSVYDIEGCERYPDVVEELMDVGVFISEKIEGTNVSFSANVEKDGKITFFTNQRNYTLLEIDGRKHSLWEMFRKLKMDNILTMLISTEGASNVTIYGEFIGPKVQGNPYKLKSHEFLVFDIKIDGRFMSFSEMFLTTLHYRLGAVPTISCSETLRDVLNGKTITEYSNGKSLLNPSVLREGIVIKPLTEKYSESLKGRLIIKKRDPIYLSKGEY
ncbi:MAG: hypothetical protein M0P71_00990 [Melioribacteraceae bacterium]|nr:hypothetical protein [Melioribacteraceae bacterium]